jgi:hypothetical protein
VKKPRDILEWERLLCISKNFKQVLKNQHRGRHHKRETVNLTMKVVKMKRMTIFMILHLKSIAWTFWVEKTCLRFPPKISTSTISHRLITVPQELRINRNNRYKTAVQAKLQAPTKMINLASKMVAGRRTNIKGF